MRWFLPTRGRPEECRQLIAAMQATGEVPDVAVMVDDDPAVYADVAWPDNWVVHHWGEHLEMTRAVNKLLALYPGQSCYGFFGDHFRPQTPMFAELEKAAGDWLMAWPSDGGFSRYQPSGALTFGGKLVDLLGWICLPTTVHLCTDRVWWQLWKDLGNVRHLDAARFQRSFPLGQGMVKRTYQGQDCNERDFVAWTRWRDIAAPGVVQHIRRAMHAEGYLFGSDGKLAPQYGCLPLEEGQW